MRLCKTCGNPLERKPNEGKRHFAKRVTCGPRCAGGLAGKRQRKAVEPRPCEICGEIIPRHDNETPSSYYQRKCCGRDECKRVLHSRAAQIPRRAPTKRPQRVEARLSPRDAATRREAMTELQREAYRQLCRLVGWASEEGVRRPGSVDYRTAVEESLRIVMTGGFDEDEGAVVMCGEGA